MEKSPIEECIRCGATKKDAREGVDCNVWGNYWKRHRYQKIVQTLIECPASRECCGCLVGKVDKKANCVNFYCNECNYMAGYIDLKLLTNAVPYKKKKVGR